MPQPNRAWWDDVQYLREPLERKREKEARRGLRLDARAAARAVAERHAGEPIADAENVHELDAVPRRRFERAAPERRGRFSRAERGTGGRAERGTGGRAEHGVGGHAEHDSSGHAEHDSSGRGAEAPVPLPPPSRRRTVEITGRTVGAPTLPRLVQIDRRRPARRAVERVGARPDRLALWAVVLAFFLIFVAVTSSSHAATRAHGASAAAGRAVHQQHVQAHTATLRAIPPAR